MARCLAQHRNSMFPMLSPTVCAGDHRLCGTAGGVMVQAALGGMAPPPAAENLELPWEAGRSGSAGRGPVTGMLLAGITTARGHEGSRRS